MPLSSGGVGRPLLIIGLNWFRSRELHNPAVFWLFVAPGVVVSPI